MLSFVFDSQEIICLARLFCAARLLLGPGTTDHTSRPDRRQCLRIRILRFFQISKTRLFTFFEIMCQKVAENPEKKFRPRSMEMSSHSSLSDHCNSVPSSPTMIHSEADSEEQWRWTIDIKQPYIGLSPKKRPSRFIINKQLAFETRNLAELWR